MNVCYRADAAGMCASTRSNRRPRFTTFFDPQFEEIGGAAMGVAEWRNREIE